MKFEMSKDSLFAVLLRSQWWISFLIAAGLFAAARFWLPDSYAFFVALPFLVIACHALWRQLRAPGASRIASTLEAVRAMSWEEFSGLLEAAFEQVAEALVRHAAEPGKFRPRRQMVAVDGGEEEKGADALVQIGLAPAVGVEGFAGREQFRDRAVGAPLVDRSVAQRGIRGLDDINDAVSHEGRGVIRCGRRGVRRVG